MKQLANLYYDDGKDREAALAYNLLDQEKPLSPEAPGFQGKIVDCVLRAGQQEDDRRAGAPAGEDHRRRREVGRTSRPRRTRSRWPTAKDLSERTLSNLAVNWHNEGREDPRRRHLRVRQRGLRRLPDALPGQHQGVRPAVLLGRAAQRQPPQVRPRPSSSTRLVVVAGRQGDRRQARSRASGSPTPATTRCYAADEVVQAGRAEGRAQAPERSRPDKTVVPLAPQSKTCSTPASATSSTCPRARSGSRSPSRPRSSTTTTTATTRRCSASATSPSTTPDYKFDNGDRAGEIAANLVLDSYNCSQDYKKVNEWARKFYANDKLATGQVQGRPGEGHRAVELQAGEPARGEEGVRKAAPGLPGLRQGLPEDPDRRQGALQRLHRLLQRAHAGEGARRPRAAVPQLPPQPAGPRLPAGQRRGVRGHRRLRARRRGLRAVRERLREAARAGGEGQEGRAARRRASTPRPRRRSRRRRGRSGRSRRRRLPSSTPASTARASASSARR